MENLTSAYQNHLDQLKTAIQNSDLLAAFLEDETEELYKQLIETFEPHINEFYVHVALKNPLQLIALENALLDPGFEGLYLPRILGFSVLRGEIDENYKYIRPQEHFKTILLEIIDSANFDYIKNRIGQTVQLGFALSSDIWLANINESITNKKVKFFLNQHNDRKYLDEIHREELYKNYELQFEGVNFLTATFPSNVTEMNIYGSSLITFLEYRSHRRFNNENLQTYFDNFLNTKGLSNHKDYIRIIMLIGMFYDIDENSQKALTEIFDQLRKDNSNFVSDYFTNLLEIYRTDIELTPEADKKMSKIFNKKITDSVSEYYKLMDVVHTKGYVHDDTIAAVKVYYESHKGQSIENECLRESIFGYCESFLNNLDAESYQDYFEINKVFVSYINTFYNQKFNQHIKDLSLKYINKLMGTYTEKRSKDYQDIKKFVTSNFLDLGFMDEKELKKFFATKRGKKA